MKLWQKILTAILIFLLLLIILAGTLISTTRGLHLVINSAARWVPGLDIAKVEGGWRDLTLHDVRYEMPGVFVNAATLHLSVEPKCLTRLALCINDVSLNETQVVVNTRELPAGEASPDEEESSGEINAPLPISLKHLGLSNTSVKVDDTAISLAGFSAGVNWEKNALTLTPTSIQRLLVALPKPSEPSVESESSASTEDYPQTDVSPAEKLSQLFAKPLLPEMADFKLPLKLTIQDITAENLEVTGTTPLLIKRLQIQAQTSEHDLQLTRFDIDSDQGQLSASGQAAFTGNWPVDLQLTSAVNIQPVQGQKLNLSVQGGLREKLNLALVLAGPVNARLNAQTELATAGLPLDIHLTSPQLRWPLTDQVQYQADNLDFSVKGKATDYIVSLGAAIKGESLPPATLSLNAKGNTAQFSLDKLRLAVLEGEIDLTALVDWTKAISWHSELSVAKINSAKQYPDLPARLDGKIVTRGSLYGDSWQVRVPELKLNGNIKQNKVSADGSLYGNSYHQWDIPGIKLALGRNYLDIKGTLRDQLNLDADIDAQHLDDTLPGLGGIVKGTLKARGTLEAPKLTTDLVVNRLRWQAMQVRQITMKGDISSDKVIAGDLAIRIRQLKQDTLKIDDLTLNAQGDEQQHQLKLSLRGEPVAGQLALNGSFDRQQQQWQGALSQTRFDTPAGELRLSKPMTINYQHTQQTATIGAHCWLNPHAEVCVSKPVEAGPNGQAEIALNRFDLAMIKPFMPEETSLKGVFTGNAKVAWTNDGGLPTGDVVLQGKGVKVVQDVQGNKLPIAFDTLKLNAGMHQGKAQLGWLLRIAGNGQLDGDIQITDPQERRALAGKVNISRLSLDILNPALMKGEKIAGMLNSQLRLGGDLKRPQVFGQLGLHDVKVDGGFMPVDLKSARLDLTFNGMSSLLEGLVDTEKGQLNLNGNADWSQPENWQAKLAAKGDKIRVVVPPMVKMDVSPDLVFDASPAAFNLNGRVDIPWARIEVQEVPESAVGVSSDEVILDEQLNQVESKGSPIPINSNLVIRVGNNVRLSAFGLKAKLNGDLKLVQDKRGLGLNGQINIPSGRFNAYGQDLLVRKGELQFAGAPDQPYLNLEAIRNPEATENNVTAGVRVTGLADEPKVEIFSDPAMPQQEALSYLLRGQGLNSGGDSNALTSALVGLGVAKSGKMMGKIGETFGVSNLALDTAGAGDSQQVQVSGYVLPGLQVKYGVGLFDSLATLTLRYRLMPKLYVEAVSGLDQALDLLYQFEF